MERQNNDAVGPNTDYDAFYAMWEAWEKLEQIRIAKIDAVQPDTAWDDSVKDGQAESWARGRRSRRW